MIVIMTDGDVGTSELKEVEKLCASVGDIKLVFILVGEDKALSVFDSDCLILFREDADEVLYRQCLKVIGG